MQLEVEGPVWYWRGPAPHHFVRAGGDEAAALAEVAPLVSYGWGMIPVSLVVGRTSATTALWPKDGGYLVPLAKRVREAEGLEVDDVVRIRLTVDV